MFSKAKHIDGFSRNILIVFAGTSLVNFLNLLYQLLVAHKLSAPDFASFNSLLALFTVISSPIGTLQTAVAKYAAEFNAKGQINKLKFLLSDLFKKTFVLAVITFLVFWLVSNHILAALKIPSVACGYILTALLASICIIPAFTGAVQGLELFGWLSLGAVLSGAAKLGFSFILISLGYNIGGALLALLFSNLVILIFYYLPLKNYISLKEIKEDIPYKEILFYLLPVAVSNFCFLAMVGLDMVLVKCFFSQGESGAYSLAQMTGKIFLFLPAAISVVMFPRTSHLKAKNMDTQATLKRSLLYVSLLCVLAGLFYNLFPEFVLKVLTGKSNPASVLLGRLFSISMSFFTLSYVLIAYFLSLKDLRFIKYLVFCMFFEVIAISSVHRYLLQVQAILCITAVSLFIIQLALAFKRNKQS